jgi:integrase
VRFLKKIVMSATFAASELTVASAEAQPLRTYIWKYRPLIVFAPKSSNAQLVIQRMIVSRNLAGFRERSMAVIEVTGSGVRNRLGPLPRATANALRKYYGVTGREFRAILVGKDGGSKLQSSRAMSTRRLFRTIDAMPMRRQEMRSGRGLACAVLCGWRAGFLVRTFHRHNQSDGPSLLLDIMQPHACRGFQNLPRSCHSWEVGKQLVHRSSRERVTQ